MRRLLLLWIVCTLAVVSFVADDSAGGKQSKAQDRIQAAADVLNEIQAAPDQGIPSDVLGSAECVAVVPTMLNGGFIVGARYGRGLASCRNPKGWSAPAFFSIKGGSFGLQIGGQAVDLVMLVMNDDGMHKLLSSQFKLGADASVAAGPVGRQAAAGTDWKMRAQILSYSRARGVSAGLALDGAVVRQDKDSTREFYGHMGEHKSFSSGTDPGAASRVSIPANAGQMGPGCQQVTQNYVSAEASALHWLV
jgi:lipid-binding SYLF domain-containing protein